LKTAVIAVAKRVLSAAALPLTVYGNGDQVQGLDVPFRCRAVSGTVRLSDEESVDVGWFRLDEPPASLPDRHRQCTQDAMHSDPAARFELG
jgi:hypothetical protein